MYKFSEFDGPVPSPSSFEHPHYLALNGEPAYQARTMLVRKGAMLQPALSDKEADGIVRYMRLEHFKPGSMISAQAQSDETGRLMLILAGEANIRMSGSRKRSFDDDFSPLGQVQAKWFNVSEGATLGLVHAFSGLSSRFEAQGTELFVASMTRLSFNRMKQLEPVLALRFFEITALELALITLDHERNFVVVSNVARSMQDHIGQESGHTVPARL